MQILIMADCVVDTGTDAGGVHCAARTVVDPRADVAHGLVRLGRALYVHEKDDPTRTKHLTARSEQLPQDPAPRPARKRTELALDDAPPPEESE